MARKSLFAAVAIGGGLLLSSPGVAAAVSTPSPSPTAYPPSPTASPTAVPKPIRHFPHVLHGGGGGGCCGHVPGLPFTGAPIAAVAVAGGGLLALGAGGTVIAVRRRRTQDAH